MIIFRKRVTGLTEASLRRFLAQASRLARLPGQVNLLVTHSAELRQLNRRFRGKDRPTDVLSFPALLEGFAGDIAISADMARGSAQKLGHSAADEVRILALHGLLHLAGHDHEDDEGQMARKEERLRKALGLPTALIERSGNGGPSARQRAKAGVRRRSR